MRLTLVASSLFLCAVAGPLAAAEPNPAGVYCRISFDEAGSAVVRGKPLAPLTMKNAAFEASQAGQSLRLTAGTVLKYALTAAFPSPAGSLEIRFKPGFSQDPQQAERTLFTLTDDAGSSIAFGFTPQGVRWRFTAVRDRWQRQLAASNYRAEATERWNQLVLTWDAQADGGPVLQLYRDGRFDRHHTEAYPQPFGDLRKLTIGGDDELQTAIDEIVIYDRALTEADAAFLHASAADPERWNKLAAQQAEEERKVAAARDARRALIAKLEGRVAYLINPRGGTVRDYRLPAGITAAGLRVEDVGTVDLGRFAVIYGPPGAGYQLDAAQQDVIRKFIQNGGGYVGVCAGANFAGKAKLLDMTTHSFKNQGLLTIGVEPHSITEGFAGEVVIHHGNGPIMVPGPGCNVVGSFLIGQKFPIKTAAIVAGENGRGRVVAFGPHPTGGNVEFQARGSKFTGAELGTDKLLVNALLWAAKLLD